MIIDRTFIPTRQIWVCVHIADYEKCRTIPCNEGFNDLLETERDAINVRKSTQQLGASLLEIKDLPGADFDDFKSLFKELYRELLVNEKAGERTFVFFYYAGHGI